MARIIVPRSNEREKAVYEKFNIKMIESIEENEFKEVVIEYLKSHNVLHLATCKDNVPRSTPLEYTHNGLTVYIFSEGGGKFANLKVNPKVAYSICDPYDPTKDFFSASGLQVWGNASTFKKNDDLKRFEEIRKYSRRRPEDLSDQTRELQQAASKFNFNVIIIEPVKICYLNLRKGFRNVIWEKDA